MSPKPTQRYHHGDLRPTLLREAQSMVRELGLDGLSLRQLAQRAGVSASALYHHFDNKNALLCALAEEGFGSLDAAVQGAARDQSGDLRDQTLELAIRPGTRKALGVNPAQLASLVVAKGPIRDPKLTLDAKGAANLALAIGAAAATGGWSALASGLAGPASDPHPCVYALTGVEAKAPAAPAGSKPAPKQPAAGPEELRKLLRGIFK